MRQTERHRGKCRVALCEFRINLTFDWKIDARLFETAAANIGHVRNSRPDTERRSPVRFNSVSAGDEFNFARAERVVHVESEGYALLVPLRDLQLLARLTFDRQLWRSFGAQLDLGLRAGTFDVVGDRHARFELVTGHGQHGHTWRDHKRSANERVAIGRTDRVA